MSRFVFLCFLLITLTNHVHSQNNSDNEQILVNTILQDNSKYKILYIYCNYCQISVERFPKLCKFVKSNENFKLFPICAQDSTELLDYRNEYNQTIHFINQGRKRKAISFYNPIKATCKFLKKNFDVDIKKIGASDYIIIDRNNNIIKQTDWDMNDSDYLNQLYSIK